MVNSDLNEIYVTYKVIYMALQDQYEILIFLASGEV
jgi:hypothetical protein